MARKKKGKKNKKGKKKKGLFGGLFGGKSETPPATPVSDDGGGGPTMVPGYAAGGDAAGGVPGGDMTMVPEYMQKMSKSGTGHVTFGEGAPPAGGAGVPADPFNFDAPPPVAGGPAPGEMTMAPGYAAGVQPADPFNFDAPAPGGPAPGEMTMAPGYAADGQPAAGEMTMMPNYSPGGASPELDPYNPGAGAEMTLAPGYSLGDMSPPPAPNTGFADGGGEPAAGEMTMVPNYTPDGMGAGAGDLTMAPNYSPQVGVPGAPAALPDPFADSDLTLQPNYGGPAGLADPFADAPVGVPGNAGGAVDPFNFDAQTAPPPAGAAAPPLPGQPAPLPDPFNFDAQSPFTATTVQGGNVAADPFNATTLKQDPFDFDAPTLPQPPGVASPFAGSDPFGPPLLDDPGAGAAMPDPFADPLGGPSDDLAERTLIDVGQEPGGTEELEIGDLGALAPPAPLPRAPAPLPGAPMGPPPAPVPAGLVAGAPSAPVALASAGPGARPLFGACRQEQGAVSYADPAAEVVVDAERCTVFAPSVPGGWSGVPARFAVLSDGAVVGRVTSVAGNVVRLAAPPALERATAQDGQVTVPPPPAGVKVDAVSRAVFVPSELEGQMAWLPDDICRVESGLSFVLAKGVEVREDGSWSVPSGLCEPKAAAGALAATGRHGEVTRRSEYLGLVERTHADGWTCLELPADAEPTGDGRLLLASSARRAPGSVPPLLRVEAQADGRLALQLPAGTEQRTDGVWFSSPLEPADDELVLADHDGAVQDEQSYMGIRDALLEGDWIRLDLPAGSRVDDGALVLPPEFSALGDPRLRGAFDRLADGSLVFKLPDGAEVLGSRVLIPPAGAVSVAATPAATASAPPKAPTPPKAPSKSKGKKLSGLDRFRGSKATNDEVSFDGVLKSDDTAPEDESPAEDKSEDETPADEAPADEAPADETPADETPADEAPADETPADEAPADETPEDETPADETPADEKPEGETPDGESSDGETPEAASADATGTRKKTKRKRRKRKKK